MQANPARTDRVHLVRDMIHALGLAAAAGVGTALASGLVVILLAIGGA